MPDDHESPSPVRTKKVREAHQIQDIMNRGPVSVARLIEETGLSEARVRGHIKYEVEVKKRATINEHGEVVVLRRPKRRSTEFSATATLTEQASLDAFLNVMRNYKRDGIVFKSVKRGHRYTVENVDDSGCDVSRLDGTESLQCSLTHLRDALQSLQAASGRMPLRNFAGEYPARKAVLLQHSGIAVSADRTEVRYLQGVDDAVDLLCEYIDTLNVDKSSGTPKLYKPVLLRAVFSAMAKGELNENRVAFDWVMPQFLDLLRQLGEFGGEEQGAMAFCHLASEPFWLLAYQDPKSAISSGEGLSPTKVREQVKFAQLRAPFWDALQSPDNTRRVIQFLDRRWLEAGEDSIRIDREVLARAVKAKIRPILIDEGGLQKPSAEGFHHQQVIPVAHAALQPDQLAADPIGSVKKALQGSKSLLIQFERSHALDFLSNADPDEVHDHVSNLLYGSEDLTSRIHSFVEWSGVSKSDDSGLKVGFNPTVISYLLAVSAPDKYAFCKPDVYKAAAKALLGPSQVIEDRYERLEHASRFYTEALRLLRDEHGLPFSDLMHTHIAFFVMNAYPARGTWQSVVSNDSSSSPLQPKTMAPLNQILYGPPGTGKTYQTLSRAVEICDGAAPEDPDEIAARFRQLRAEGQIEFVTFHQSYSYEDFVEGIRPVLDNKGDDESTNNGDVRYECRDGVFKRICSLAPAKSKLSGGEVDLDLPTTGFWKMSLGNTGDPEQSLIYEDCIEGNFLLLGFGDGLDLSSCNTRQAIYEKLHEVEPDVGPKDYSVRALDYFKNEMAEGDIVIVTEGNRKFRAIGRVNGPYELTSRQSYSHKRPVEWLVVYDESVPRELISSKDFSQQAIYRLDRRRLNLIALRDNLSAKEASQPNNYVLVIDEINRGNIAKIFGELITLLEPDKRIGGKNELRTTLPYSGSTFGVPANVYLLGTMNTADRSIALLDTALRRRFHFEEIMPDANVIAKEVGANGVVDGIDVAKLLTTINARIEHLYDRDHQLGHAYFLNVNTLTDLRYVFLHRVIPLLQEYFYGDWGKVCTVLGCPLPEDAAEPTSRNPFPIIEAVTLRISELPGSNMDWEDKFRCQPHPAFVGASVSALREFFARIAAPSS